jgi:hypothetical protein
LKVQNKFPFSACTIPIYGDFFRSEIANISYHQETYSLLLSNHNIMEKQSIFLTINIGINDPDPIADFMEVSSDNDTIA